MKFRLIHELTEHSHVTLFECDDPLPVLEELHARVATLTVGKLRVVDQRGRSLTAFYARSKGAA